jgi:hypothetical protein
MKILILIELKNRDIYPLLFLGKVLSNFGHRVGYTTYKNLGLDTLIKRYDILLINGVSTKRNISKQLVVPKLRSKKVICYYSEQMPGSNLGLNIFERFRDVLANYDLVDHHLVWGSYGREKLIECGVEARNISVVGSANYALLKVIKNYSGMNLGDFVNFHDNREIILIADNVFPCSMYGQNYWIYRKRLNDLIVQLAKFNGDKLILVRPHPSMLDRHHEDLADLLNYDNIHIRNNGHMAIWLKLASTVLFTTSTSGLEAYFIGKKVAALDIQLEVDAWHKGLLKEYSDMKKLSFDISGDNLIYYNEELQRIIDQFCYPKGLDFEAEIGLAFKDLDSTLPRNISISLHRKCEALIDLLRGGFRDLKKRWKNDIIIDTNDLIDAEHNINQILNEIIDNK